MRLTILQVLQPSEQQLVDLEKLYREQQLSQQQLQQKLSSLPTGTTAWVARFNDRYQAAALLTIAQQSASLSALAVRDFNRRRGIGSYLVQQLGDYAAKQGATRLECDLSAFPDAEQSAVAAFLAQQGFTAESNNLCAKALT